MNKIKNTIAVITISAILTISIVGLSINAYNPTITKTFSSGSGTATATATLYRDNNGVYATVNCPDVECCIVLTYAGTTISDCGYGYVSVYISGTGSRGTFYCVAGSGSTSIVF